jgi:hypothetical protein
VNGCTISGNSHVTDAIRTRGVHRSDFSNNSLINVTEAGIHTFFAVTNRYDSLHTSANEQAFTQQPANCMILDGPDTTHKSTDSTIAAPICEGVSGDGILLNDSATISILSGTSEGNAGRGINCTANCSDLRLYAPDLESNTTEDFLINGTGSDYGGIFGSTNKIHVGATGNFTFYSISPTCISTIDGGGVANGIAAGCGGLAIFAQIGQTNYCGVNGASHIETGDATAVIGLTVQKGTSAAPNAAGFVNLANLSFKEVAAPATAANFDLCYGDSTAHVVKCSYNNGTFFNVPQVIASGTATMTTAAITAGNCGTTVTVAATGTATTDSIAFSFNAAPAGSNAGLVSWPTANNVNFAYCPNTAETPAAATINWRVVR